MQLVTKRTDAQGTIVWRERTRPSFALAESGAGRAFVSLLPQAPPPASIVALRLESAVARAGERIRFVGFARRRSGSSYRRETGDVRVTLAGKGATLAATAAHLDESGAFSGDLRVPAALDAGDYAVLASAAGGVGGTSLHVDASSDVTLALRTGCPCDADRDVPFALAASRAGAPAPDVPVRVEILRVPHVVPPGGSDDAARWGTTIVYDRTVRTDAEGRVRLTIPAPTDGLDSTYGVRASTRGASATTRIVVPVAQVSLALEPDAPGADVGQPVGFDVRAFDPSDGMPVPNLTVRVRLTHGASAQEQSVVLDARGRGRAVFKSPSLGSNLAVAETTVEGRRASDAAAVLVEPSALAGKTLSARNAVTVATDQRRYRAGAAHRRACDGARRRRDKRS